MANFRVKFLNSTPITTIFELIESLDITPYKSNKLTIERLKGKIKAENIDLSLSIGAFIDKKLVAIILHGNNNGKLFNALTYISPEFKDQGLINKMYDYALPLFRRFELKKISIEVSTSNDALIRSYRKIGFKKWRTVESVYGLLDISNLVQNEEVMIQPASYYDFLILYAEKDILPSFENSEYCISNMDNDIIIKKAVYNSTTVGYIVYRPSETKIIQLWVKESFRRKKVGTTLVHAILSKNDHIHATNIDSQYFPLLNFCKKLGGNQIDERVEMELFL
ncbi:MAG: GNAT family N-acetyltransferase [Flavobacteriaceae bacterium]|jgi:ribosomal protein S18 acetylase RimI-like enzyme|nr:GNAT family N-acetyltransferase [Flavobacteriaceae bacterium]